MYKKLVHTIVKEARRGKNATLRDAKMTTDALHTFFSLNLIDKDHKAACVRACVRACPEQAAADRG